MWIDFRGIQDEIMRARGIDYFENSRRATYVQQQYAIHNPSNYRGYGEHCWGITASDGPGPASLEVDGVERYFYDYEARGIPDGPDDGTIAPWAAVASLPFAPEIVLPALQHFNDVYPEMTSEYGFKCSFNPTFIAGNQTGRGWISKGYYGLDQGPIVMMIENYRSGFLWKLMKRCRYIREGLSRAGFTGGWLSSPVHRAGLETSRGVKPGVVFRCIPHCSFSSSPSLRSRDTARRTWTWCGWTRACFAAIRRDPLSLAVNSNSLIIVRDSDVVVVDAQFTRAATQETIAAIRSVTRKPVRYVINTHWHDDHLAGDQVYQDSFPSVRFVMQENTATDLVTLGAPNRKSQVEGIPAVVDRFDHLLSLGLGMDSTPASPRERAALESAIRIARQYVKEAPGFRAVTATDTVHRRMTLGQGRDRVDLLWFGYGNTRGDLIVHLPSRGIVATGDLIGAPVPFAFNSYPASWIKVLDSLLALHPRMIVPGHGPVLHDLRYVRSVRGWLARINRETSAAAREG